MFKLTSECFQSGSRKLSHNFAPLETSSIGSVGFGPSEFQSFLCSEDTNNRNDSQGAFGIPLIAINP